MKTVKHTVTHFYYDGVQVFEARDTIGRHYIVVRVEPGKEGDRFLVAGAEPERLRQFRSGQIDLRCLLTDRAETEWFLGTTSQGIEGTLDLVAQNGALQDSTLLPDSGFVLHNEPANKETVRLPEPGTQHGGDGLIVTRTSEAAFETVLEAHLLANGYVSLPREGFDRERAIYPEAVLTFIRDTQSKEWAKLEALHGEKTGEQILSDLCKWMDANGSLATLRHGFKCYGKTLRVAFFKAAHGLNPELEARYAANRIGITRQLHFSPRSEKSLDVTISLNGIPIVTAELKNPMTGQTIDNALWQYRHDRDPREPVFEFKRRTLVHFAVDTEAVFMTTRLAGTATHFLPFNKGCAGGAGNPPDPAGRTYRTAYLWEEVLQRDSLLDLLARFIHLQIEEKRDDQGRKVKKETMIFPRYHQLQAVRSLVDAARREGVGNNYLVEHSAGSGKSNTIAWLTHRLASLHDAHNERVFDSVIVVTDRVVLDQQLQDTSAESCRRSTRDRGNSPRLLRAPCRLSLQRSRSSRLSRGTC
jgi:hypothetical protein